MSYRIMVTASFATSVVSLFNPSIAKVNRQQGMFIADAAPAEGNVPGSGVSY